MDYLGREERKNSRIYIRLNEGRLLDDRVILFLGVFFLNGIGGDKNGGIERDK